MRDVKRNIRIGINMNKPEDCLNKLIDSCKKKVGPRPMGMEKIGLNFYRNKNKKVLALIGGFNQETENQFLNDYDVISKGEIFLNFFTGCVAPLTINYMLNSFHEYNGENVSSDMSTFIQSLEASKIVMCYANSSGGSNVALVVLYKICQQLKIDCLPIIIKPALWKRSKSYQREFVDLLVYIDTYTYHIYDESLSSYKPKTKTSVIELNNAISEDLLKIVNKVMKL